MSNEQEKSSAKFDAEKSSKVADMLAAQITGTIGKNKPQSIAEGLLMMTLAVARTIHVLGVVMGCNPKMICKDFCTSLTKYFEMGGDTRIEDIAAAMSQKEN